MDVRQIHVDYGIITIRPDEFLAVLDRLPGRCTVHGGRRLYEFASLETAGGRTRGIAVVRCLEQGQGIAQAVARDMIDDLDPGWLLLVGIAGGIPDDDFTLGDVLVASRVHDFSVSAAIQDRDAQWSVGGGPVHKYVELLLAHLPALKDRIAGWNTPEAIGRKKPPVRLPDRLESNDLYGPNKQKVFDSLRRHFSQDARPRGPIVFVGPTASSNMLVKDADLLSQWQQAARAVSHIEMELAAVYLAARQVHREYPVLAIRGLSDIVGFRRGPDWTDYACQTAAAFCLALLKSGLIEETTPWDWQDASVVPEKVNKVFAWLGGKTRSTPDADDQSRKDDTPPDGGGIKQQPRLDEAAMVPVPSTDKLPGILIIGPGGTGKTTFAKLLTGHYNRTPFEVPGPYDESYQVERYSLEGTPAAEIVVPPGQEFRREANWNSLFGDLKVGRFRGIIFLVAYGYHSLGQMSYKAHELYKRTKKKSTFLKAYLEARRKEELEVLGQLVPPIMQCDTKLWFLTLVGKEDLWSIKRAEVDRHYRESEFGDEIQKIQNQRGINYFRYELALASLVISNFTSSVGETLLQNSAGYDQGMQVKSLRRLVELFDSLRKWEEGL